MPKKSRWALWLLIVCVVLPNGAVAKSCPQVRHTARAVAVAEATDITVATQNLEKFFDDQKNGPARVLSTEAYRIKREKLAKHIRENLRQPDVLAVQEAENLAVLNALAARISSVRNKPRYQAYHYQGPDSGGHHSGFLVRSDWKLLGMQAILKQEKLGRAALFDRPPLLIRLQTNSGKRFEVLNVHLKSLMGANHPKKMHKVAAKRQRQAEVLAQWLERRLADKNQLPLVMLGDFNALPAGTANMAGGVDVMARIERTGMRNVMNSLPLKERFSYVFRCEPEALDYALLSPGWQLRQVAFSRGNAEGHRRYTDDPSSSLRSSDHDGLVLYLRK